MPPETPEALFLQTGSILMKKIFSLCLLIAATAGAHAQKISAELQTSMNAGRELYAINCQSCHMEQGEGLEGVYPPLAKSDYLMADKKKGHPAGAQRRQRSDESERHHL